MQVETCSVCGTVNVMFKTGKRTHNGADFVEEIGHTTLLECMRKDDESLNKEERWDDVRRRKMGRCSRRTGQS